MDLLLGLSPVLLYHRQMDTIKFLLHTWIAEEPFVDQPSDFCDLRKHKMVKRQTNALQVQIIVKQNTQPF